MHVHARTRWGTQDWVKVSANFEAGKWQAPVSHTESMRMAHAPRQPKLEPEILNLEDSDNYHLLQETHVLGPW